MVSYLTLSALSLTAQVLHPSPEGRGKFHFSGSMLSFVLPGVVMNVGAWTPTKPITNNQPTLNIPQGSNRSPHSVAWFIGNGICEFRCVPQYQSGLTLTGDVRGSVQIDDLLVFGVNSDSVQAYNNTIMADDGKHLQSGQEAQLQ